MFRRIALRVVLLIGVIGAGAAYYFAPWLQTEWNIYNGRQAFVRGEFEEAITKLSPIVAKHQSVSIACWDRPDCATYLRRVVAQSHLALGQDDAALSHYQQLSDSTARFAQGLNVLKGRKWNESVELFKSALQSEGECAICLEALKNAESAHAAHVSGEQAKQTQTKAFDAMGTPVKCLASVGGSVAIRTGTRKFVTPQLVSVIRKAATKAVAEEIVEHLMQRLSPTLMRLIKDVTGDVCPPLSAHESIKWLLENETAKWLWDLDSFDLIKGDVQSVASAVSQSLVLSGLVIEYGQAFNTERTSQQQATESQRVRLKHWDMIAAASKNPKFIDSGLKDVHLPTPSPSPSWIATTWEMIKPTNWFAK